jgi:DNA-binding response OmpR family regulator
VDEVIPNDTMANFVEILLIEDNEDDARLTFRALKKHNLSQRVCWMRDGEEVSDFLLFTDHHNDSEKKLKLILLDLKLPKINGLQILKEIKDHRVMKMVPVVVLTSSKEERDIFESYELGVNSYLIKPINFSEFEDLVWEISRYWLIHNHKPN